MKKFFKMLPYLFCIYMVFVLITACMKPTPSNNFNWNNEQDVNGFLEWKEDNGSGWSDN